MATRRHILKSLATLPALTVAPKFAFGTQNLSAVLRPFPKAVSLVPEQYGKTPVWCFNGSVPGPEIRVKQGERVRVRLDNALVQETTVHWHGLRLPNNMDGVPHLTQKPVAPGQSFLYEFDAVDAGTFWYHPHQQSAEQVGRGLYGCLVVEEHEPPRVDRDVSWVLDDWRLNEAAHIVDDFGHFHDMSHGGRLGNTVTINGFLQQSLKVRRGERIRLRLVNTANARIFGLEFQGHEPKIIAIDGQPVRPHSPNNGRITLAPAMRVDLILDMTGETGSAHPIIDSYYSRGTYQLSLLDYSEEALRENSLESGIALAPNPVPEPELGGARVIDVLFEGGAMGRMEGAKFKGEWLDIRTLVRNGAMWAINGIAATGHVLDPLFELKRGETCVLRMSNDTAWPHPIHLHGHSFRVLRRNGEDEPHQPLQDTVLMESGDQVEIAFVADNPGDWMFHCHVLEHQMSGMMGVVRVA